MKNTYLNLNLIKIHASKIVNLLTTHYISAINRNDSKATIIQKWLYIHKDTQSFTEPLLPRRLSGRCNTNITCKGRAQHLGLNYIRRSFNLLFDFNVLDCSPPSCSILSNKRGIDILKRPISW